MCNRCDLGIIESIHHLRLVMQCSFNVDERVEMYRQLKEIYSETVKSVLSDPQKPISHINGKAS